MAGVSLKLVVLRTPQVDRLRAFYQALGVELAEEQHGGGPPHYAGRVGDAVLEIYRCRTRAVRRRQPPGWASGWSGWPRSSRPSAKPGCRSQARRGRRRGACGRWSGTRTGGRSSCTGKEPGTPADKRTSKRGAIRTSGGFREPPD
jgi:hypothetical protein